MRTCIQRHFQNGNLSSSRSAGGALTTRLCRASTCRSSFDAVLLPRYVQPKAMASMNVTRPCAGGSGGSLAQGGS